MLGVRNVLLALALGLLGGAPSGCFVEEVPPADYVDEGYAPMTYDGYIVYYDDWGRPYYYAGGAVYWVPPASPLYIGLVNHWRVYRPAYRRWYAHYGYRYPYRYYRHR
jgi:hypothetical protein